MIGISLCCTDRNYNENEIFLVNILIKIVDIFYINNIKEKIIERELIQKK